MKICTVTTDKGRAFNVRRVDPGEYWGRNQCMKATETMVEFWDARYSEVSPLGQFIYSYKLDTMMEHDPGEDLILSVSVLDWQIGAAALRLALWEVAGLIPNYADARFDAGPLTIRIP